MASRYSKLSKKEQEAFEVCFKEELEVWSKGVHSQVAKDRILNSFGGQMWLLQFRTGTLVEGVGDAVAKSADKIAGRLRNGKK